MEKKSYERCRCQPLTLGTEMMLSVVTLDPDCNSKGLPD